MENLVKVNSKGNKVYARQYDYERDSHDFINIHIASPNHFAGISDELISSEYCKRIVDIDGVIKPTFERSETSLYYPLYGYVHSGACISTTPFNCPFDSGLIGVIVVDKEAVRKTYNCFRITKKIQERIDKEIQEYISYLNFYLSGDIYEIIEVKDGEGILESTICYGYNNLIDAYINID